MKTQSKDGTEIYFEVNGTGDTALLFVHGWLGNTTWWNSQRDHFSKNYQVATMDLAGHGQSGKTRTEYTTEGYADDIVAVASQLKAKKIVLIGHSMSGVYATEASLSIQNLDRLILIDTMKNLDFFFPADQTEAFLKLYRDDFKNVVETMLPAYLFGVKTPDAIRARLQKEFLDQAVFAEPAIRPLYFTDSRPAAKQITVPVRAIMADMMPTALEINRKYFRNYDYITMAGFGHYPMLENSDEFNQKLEQVLVDPVLVPWGEKEKVNWFKEQTIKRSYKDEVVSKIQKLGSTLDVSQYGALSLDSGRYPLFLLKTKNFDASKKTVLITGGVHGYETSGVHGALAFMENEVAKYTDQFNFVCTPCISPWAYETINRWNSKAVDPNRSFRANSPAEECQLFLDAIAALKVNVFAHFDLHETTDTDNTVFRPALEQRDAKPQEFSEIPDGFYVVGDTNKPDPEFQRAIIASVKKVTHIAPADERGMIIGAPIEGEGVIHYDLKKLFLCAGFSDAEYTTTTEVYPDSPKVTDENCNQAQVAAIVGGLDYLKN